MTEDVLSGRGGSIYQLIPHWNYGMIAASIGISLLGAFTSTQLMCQARLSKYMSGVLLWTVLGSLTFGFCSIWCLHFVAMLACELDLPIGLNVPLTVMSALVAVSFTFAALASDLVWDKYNGTHRRRNLARRKDPRRNTSRGTELLAAEGRSSTEALLPLTQECGVDEDVHGGAVVREGSQSLFRNDSGADHLQKSDRRPLSPFRDYVGPKVDSLLTGILKDRETPEALPTLGSIRNQELDGTPDQSPGVMSERDDTDAFSGASSEAVLSRRSSAVTQSDASTFGLGNIMSVRVYRPTAFPGKNAFVVTAKVLYVGCTWRNITRGFLWSLAITSMHYMGILALEIPDGYFKLSILLVISSALISWVVCSVGCILMAHMETQLAQQFLFSVVATTGVAAMHFTGMKATTFWSYSEPSPLKGYPPELAAAIASIAIITCLSANYLLAHSATVARNKLAEIVHTRKKLWAAIAQKENAEAAARARSDFIASASHEIRTPLHQLQGYSDLLSRTEMSEEGRLLLYAIQHATKTLSLITSNVLDWSRLEKGEAACRPVALDVRVVCESIINLLPNRDDEVQAELMVVVTPEVPQSLFLDETYVHRILMNLLSNALKFTSLGYILLLIEMKNDRLVATVKDSGQGIPESFLPDLFEPFKQAQTRGAERGTGLGMSIIKQLLEKMQGTIEVSSRYHQADSVRQVECGSTFIVSIPTQSAMSTQQSPDQLENQPQIAILPVSNERTLQGLCMAWEKFGFNVIPVESVADLPNQLKYVWATIPFLKKNQSILKQLLEQDNFIVLIPCDSSDTFTELPGLSSAPNFIPLQRPLMWHRISQIIATAGQARSKGFLDKTVRFATEVDVMGGDGGPPQTEPISRTFTILLVEDNSINQKLGTKMLKTLGYDVLTADDGQDAVEKILEHDSRVDAILMDQSMPRKDGLTATREIRMMEEDGTLSHRRPIIAVTAVVGPEAQAMCRDAGTDDFLAKPLSLAKLEQALKQHLRFS